MKKVCANWAEYFPEENIGAVYWEEFARRAEMAGATVLRVDTLAQARQKIRDEIKSVSAKKIVIANQALTPLIKHTAKSRGIALITDPAGIRQQADTADIGIAAVEFGIAETGSVCEDALAIEERLVTTLPPLCILLLNSNHIVSDVATAFDILAQVFRQGYISFLTGPSRTSDIERVLTIGVHGPSRLLIIGINHTECPEEEESYGR